MENRAFRHTLHFGSGANRDSRFFVPRGKALYRDMVGIMNEAATNNGECRVTSPWAKEAPPPNFH